MLSGRIDVEWNGDPDSNPTIDEGAEGDTTGAPFYNAFYLHWLIAPPDVNATSLLFQRHLRGLNRRLSGSGDLNRH
jgi:hypothetical protein